MTSNRVSRMNVQNENLAINDCFDRKHRVRNQSCSASSTMSSTSSNSSSATTTLNQNFLIDVLIVYPNGFQIAKKLDSRKAVYDILIELSATAKLIPTNYTLKLFSKDEGDANSNNYKLIDYTPNQTIGHLNPAKINIIPKTTTLKHQQHQLLTGAETKLANKSFSQILSINNLNSKSKTPFELTIRIGVNLPHNQKTAIRVKPDIVVSDLFECICKETGLDSNKYDLVINSKTIHPSMRETFDLYQTNEVTLVLKNYDKPPNHLNSKSSISIFNQHSTKSRSQKKLITNKTTNQHKTENELGKSKFKSKSELDLSINSKINSKNSTSNLSIKSSNQSGMFSFFMRKKNQKSKSKLSINDDNRSLKSATMISESVLHNSNSVKSISSSQIDSQFLLAKFNKKRHAPPPPPATSTLNAVPEINEMSKQEQQVEKQNSIRSKSVVDERNNLSDFDREALEKIIALTKKKKKAAPLPPTQTTQSNSLKIITNLSPKSRSSNENLSSKIDYSDKCSTSPPSFPSPSLSESSSINSNKNDDSAKTNDAHSGFEVEENSKCSFSNNSFQKPVETRLNQAFDSINQNSLTSSIIYDTHDNTNLSPKIENKFDENKNNINLNETLNNKKPNEDSILISDENCVKSFYGAVSDHKIFSEDDLSDIDSVKAFNSPYVTTSPLHHSKYAVQSMPNQVTKIVINKNLNSPNKCESVNTLKLDTKIPNVIVEADDKSSVQNYDTDSDKTYSDMSKNESDQETQLEINIGSYRTPIKKTAIIEVCPEFETSSLITIATQQQETTDQQNSPKSPQINQIKKSTINLILKSPTSPPPQFPAIGENEINEQHQNYTVVRSGDIIEKNGIYYSTDGTIRGYSGIVKKLASSKQLKEVFQKQQELEQQHEREYQLELQKKELEEKQKNLSENSNIRPTINKIVSCEKKTTPITTGQNLLKTVQYRKTPEMRSPTTKSILDDELSKKLEFRRQTIANQINNLEIDTSNSSSLQSTSSTCTSPSIDSSSQNSPQSYFMPQNLHSVNQRKNTPSFVLSAKVRDSNYSLNKIGYNNTPEQLAHSRASLIDELKSIVPFSDGDKTLVPESPTTPIMSTFQPKNPRPVVAPKNFNHSTIETIQTKKQILNARDDLLDSIKSFSVTSLRKVNREAF